MAVGRVALGILCLATWQAGHWALGADWISGPVDIVRRLAEITANGELVRHTMATLSEAALGFLLGGGAGILLPFALRWSPRLTAALDPFFTAAMGVPKLALAPLLILWFGIGVISSPPSSSSSSSSTCSPACGRSIPGWRRPCVSSVPASGR